MKLSALHPRYEAVNSEQVMTEPVPRLIELARKAKEFDLNLTVDAEEADRLELSLDVFAAALADPTLAGWDGFGLAVQAYQKRARGVIEKLKQLAGDTRQRFMVRLAKGAYWDSEIKHAQVEGFPNFPVLTTKQGTDFHHLALSPRHISEPT